MLAALTQGVVGDVINVLKHFAGANAASTLQFTVHMEQPMASGPFVQVVDVLGDQQKVAVEFVLKSGQGMVSRVGLHFFQLGAASVVETLHQFRVASKTFWCGNVLNMVVFPQTVAIAEGAHAGFGGNSGTGQYHDAAGLLHQFISQFGCHRNGP